MKISKITILILALLMFVSEGLSDVRLPAIISDNMVLQQDAEVQIWGWADAGEQIQVRGSWQEASVTTKADDEGKWQAAIKTPKAGGPLEINIQGKNRIVLKNILAGEVWVCSGQSNMGFTLKRCNNAKAEISSANYDGIRLFLVEQSTAQTPQAECKGQWVVCNSETVGNFSAVGYFFSRELHKQLNVPVGMIGSYWGGTVIEAWSTPKAVKDIIDFESSSKHQEKIDRAKKEYAIAMKKWEQEAGRAKENGREVPEKPAKPRHTEIHNFPGFLYNAMISPLMPFRIRGAIWYQGEANVARAYQYRALFPAMIENWRSDWGQGDFPFYYVQIAPFKSTGRGDGAAAELREAQLMTLSSVPNTGMAVTMDIGNPENVHPKNKQDVGKRLSLWALAKTYGQEDLVYSGPIYKSMSIETDRIRLSFDHVGSGLVAKGGDLTEFTIAGEDRKFVPAKAVIDDDTILVGAEAVKNPVAVRFAWKNDSVPNLFNKEGLPASSFRTDSWPGITIGRKRF